MRYCFDLISSFAVFHPKNEAVDPDTHQPLPSRFFEVRIAPASLSVLKRQGWLFKPFAGGGSLYVEKKFRSDGTKTFRFPLKEKVSIDFLIRLNTPELMNTTKPFGSADPTVPPPTLPAFYGRRRILYFENRKELDDPAADVIELSTLGEVSLNDFASLAPELYAYPLHYPAVNQLELQALPTLPGSDHKIYTLDMHAPVATLDTPAGPWKITRQPGGDSETVFLDSQLLPESYLALIRITKLPSAGWDRPRRYELHFASV